MYMTQNALHERKRASGRRQKFLWRLGRWFCHRWHNIPRSSGCLCMFQSVVELWHLLSGSTPATSEACCQQQSWQWSQSDWQLCTGNSSSWFVYLAFIMCIGRTHMKTSVVAIVTPRRKSIRCCASETTLWLEWICDRSGRVPQTNSTLFKLISSSARARVHIATAWWIRLEKGRWNGLHGTACPACASFVQLYHVSNWVFTLANRRISLLLYCEDVRRSHDNYAISSICCDYL